MQGLRFFIRLSCRQRSQPERGSRSGQRIISHACPAIVRGRQGDSYDITEVCLELSEQVANILDVSGAGVSVADHRGDLRFVTATSEPIVIVEQAQEESQQGPCRLAFETQEPVLIEDMGDTEWTAYATVARQHGLRAVIGYPLDSVCFRLRTRRPEPPPHRSVTGVRRKTDGTVWSWC
ncbi:MAG TPA: GAF domain-containing protein [Acidimicrobiia bacterium]|nr:GAF domain-containing protein [Acidimicrobiia bacterium]